MGGLVCCVTRDKREERPSAVEVDGACFIYVNKNNRNVDYYNNLALNLKNSQIYINMEEPN
jgi:hypothetical protein